VHLLSAIPVSHQRACVCCCCCKAPSPLSLCSSFSVYAPTTYWLLLLLAVLGVCCCCSPRLSPAAAWSSWLLRPDPYTAPLLLLTFRSPAATAI